MRMRILTLLFCILFHETIAKSGYSIEKLPQWISYLSVKDTSVYASGDLKYILLDEQINIEKQENYFHTSIKILTRNGLQTVFPITINFDPSYQKLIIHKISIIRNDIVINKLDKDAIRILDREQRAEKQMLTENLSALVNLSDLRIGDIIDIEHSINGFNPIFNEKFSTTFTLNSSVFFQKIHNSIICDLKRQIKYATTDGNILTPKITNQKNQIQYEWELNNVNPVLHEEGVPYWYMESNYLMVTDYTSWSQVVDWGEKLFKVPTKLTPRLKELYDSLKSKSPGKYSFILNTLRFIQDEIRYLSVSGGIYSHQPHDPELVIKNRYGDCKDKVLLMTTLLKLEGIDAYPELVNSTLRRTIGKFLPSPTTFDHCIIKIEIDKKKYWFDPTIPFQRGKFGFTYTPNYTLGLVISERSQALEVINQSNYSKTEVDYHYETYGFGDTSLLFIETRYFGYEADQMRFYLNNKPETEIEKDLLDYVSKNHPEVSVRNKIKSSDDQENNIITIYENYFITNFWTLSDPKDSNSYVGNFYARKISDAIYLPSSKIRTKPLMVYSYPSTYQEKIFIYVPFNIQVKPENVNEITKHFSFTSEVVQQDPRNITLTYNYNTAASHVDAIDFKEYIKQINNLHSHLTYNVYYMNSQNSSQLNWTYIISALIVLSISIALAFYINYQYNPKSAYTEEEKEPIPFMMYILLGLIAFSTLVRSFYVISALITDSSVYESFIKKDSFNFNPYLYIFYIMEFNINLIMTVFSSLCMIQFFQRRLSAVRLFLCFFLMSIVIIICSLTFQFRINSIDLTYFFGYASLSLIIGIPIIMYIITFNNSEAVFIRSHVLKGNQSIDLSKEETI